MTTYSPEISGSDPSQADSIKHGLLNGQYDEITEQEYKNGTKHLYGVKAEGSRDHLSYQQVAGHYGKELGQPSTGEFQVELPGTNISEGLKVKHECRELRQTDLDAARDNYMRLVAEHDRRIIRVGKYSQSAVDSARERYEGAVEDVLATQTKWMTEAGSDEQEVADVMDRLEFAEALHMANSLHEKHFLATGNYQRTENGKLEKVERTGWLAQKMDRVYEWFGQVSAESEHSKKATLKKAAAMAGAGMAVGSIVGLAAPAIGVAASVSGSVMVAGSGAGWLVNRVTKAYMGIHFDKKGSDAQIGIHGHARHQELLDKYGNGTNDVTMRELIAEQSERDTKLNNRRLIGGIGSAALGGALGVGVTYGFAYIGAGVKAGVDAIVDKIGDINFRLPDFFGDSNDTPDRTESTPNPTPEPTGPTHGPTIAPELDDAPETDSNNGGENTNPDKPEQHEFKQRVMIEDGNGITQEIQDEFEHVGTELTPSESYDVYEHLETEFSQLQGDYFLDNQSYLMANGDFGILQDGMSNWRPEVLAEIHRFALDQELYDKEAA